MFLPNQTPSPFAPASDDSTPSEAVGSRPRRTRSSLVIGLSVLALAAGAACSEEDDFLTTEEVDAAIASVVLIGQARQAMDDATAICTVHNPSDGPEEAAEASRAFLELEAPCASVELPTSSRVVVDFGDAADDCRYRGRLYAGRVTLEFLAGADDAAPLINHEYAGFSNGEIVIDGEATVLWDGGARRIDSQFELDGPEKDISVSESRSSLYLNENLGPAGGIEVEGHRTWTGSLGQWEMEIDGAEVRPVDPVPYQGRYELVTPRGLPATVEFSRFDAETIEMLFVGPKNQYVYRIDSAGEVVAVED